MTGRRSSAWTPARVAWRALALLLLATAVWLGLDAARTRPYQRYRDQARALSARPSASPGLVGEGVAELVVGGKPQRCVSCHALIASPAREGEPNPLRGHPGQHLKHHPPRRFGCEACHGGGGERLDRCPPAEGDPRGRALDRTLAQGSCWACHRPADHLPGAPVLTTGLQAYRRLGCGGCHRHARLSADPLVARLPGPPLDRVGRKLRRRYLGAFLADPHRLRPHSPMPSFFAGPLVRGAPPATAARIRARRLPQIRRLLAFLASLDPEQPAARPAEAAPQDQPKKGKKLFKTKGCIVCHDAARGAGSGLVASSAPAVAGSVAAGLTRPSTRRRLGVGGPSLWDAGRRLQPGWIRGWLADPAGYNAAARMPNLRLDPAQARALAAFVAGLGPDPGPVPPPVPSKGAAPGRRVAQELGCAGCHAISGMERSAPVGPELDRFGERPVELMDWGIASVPTGRRTYLGWVRAKLTRPAAFDPGTDRLRMPWQPLFAGELDGLVALMRGLVSRDTAPHRPAPVERHLRLGQRMVTELGCRRCHAPARDDGILARAIPAVWDRPPPLAGLGSRLRPAWIRRFVQRPHTVRPWLVLRMPRFTLHSRQIDEIVAYLATSSRASYPFSAPATRALTGRSLAEARTLFDRLKCVSCHLLKAAPQLKPGELAPDLGLSGARLRPGWVRRFVEDPQRVMPGTKMPELFPLADEDDPKAGRITPAPDLFGGRVDDQLDALVELSLRWSELSP